jgi:hypothetical protein
MHQITLRFNSILRSNKKKINFIRSYLHHAFFSYTCIQYFKYKINYFYNFSSLTLIPSFSNSAIIGLLSSGI